MDPPSTAAAELLQVQPGWHRAEARAILLAITAISAIVLQLMLYLRINILKPIVLIGTFALALAFAANDLVNFIGVPMAGLHAYQAAIATSDPLNVGMGMLAGKVKSETLLLLVQQRLRLLFL